MLEASETLDWWGWQIVVTSPASFAAMCTRWSGLIAFDAPLSVSTSQNRGEARAIRSKDVYLGLERRTCKRRSLHETLCVEPVFALLSLGELSGGDVRGVKVNSRRVRMGKSRYEGCKHPHAFEVQRLNLCRCGKEGMEAEVQTWEVRQEVTSRIQSIVIIG